MGRVGRGGDGGWGDKGTRGDGETNSLLTAHCSLFTAELLNRSITLDKADFADALSHTKPSLLR